MFHHQKMAAIRVPLSSKTLAHLTDVKQLKQLSDAECVCIDTLMGNSTVVKEADRIVQDVDMAMFLMWRQVQTMKKGLQAFTSCVEFSVDVWAKVCQEFASKCKTASQAASQALPDTGDANSSDSGGSTQPAP